jgi:hypothetical protein
MNVPDPAPGSLAEVWVHKTTSGWYVYADPEAARLGEDTARDLRRLPFGLRDVRFVVDEELRAANVRSTHAWAVGVLVAPDLAPETGAALTYTPSLGVFSAGGVQLQHTTGVWFTAHGGLPMCCICHFR